MTIALGPMADRRPRSPATATVPAPHTRTLTRALIVHHSDVVRAGIAALLQEGSIADSTAAVGSVYEAFRLATAFPPRAVLFDFSAVDGPDACRLLSGIWPRPRLIALVADERQVGPAVAVAAGADAVVAIDRVSREVFLQATRSVLAGMGPIAVGFSAATTDQRGVADGSPTDLLTRREREMLYLIGEGLTNREIAEALVLSVKTVETHRANLSRKLNIRSRAGLMRLAVVGGISPALAGGVA